MRRADSIQEVVDRHLCMGCGTCAAARPDIVRMVDTVAHGRRPVIASDAAPAAGRLQKELQPAFPGLGRRGLVKGGLYLFSGPQ